MAKENFQTTNSLLYLLLIVFILTFTVFPGVTFDTNLDMLKNVKNTDGWFVLMMNTIFSVFDTVGRKLGGLKQFDLSVGGIKVVSATRLIFLATFWLIAFQIGPSWLFVADWFIITNMVVFSFSNGYVSTLCAVKAPGQVPSEKAGQVGAFIGTTLTLGILLGSLIALAMTPVLKLTPNFAA